jgi:hypothetical protein
MLRTQIIDLNMEVKGFPEGETERPPIGLLPTRRSAVCQSETLWLRIKADPS